MRSKEVGLAVERMRDGGQEATDSATEHSVMMMTVVVGDGLHPVKSLSTQPRIPDKFSAIISETLRLCFVVTV